MMKWIIYFIHLFSANMNFEPTHEEQPITPEGKTKIRGFIVLMDNREKAAYEVGTNMDYRCSAFKETEVDPLEFPKNQFSLGHDDQLIAQLNRRVDDLEKRIRALAHQNTASDISNQEIEQISKKKMRRKFKELNRDKQCVYCQKLYGSQTSLKYHIKLKHTNENRQNQ